MRHSHDDDHHPLILDPRHHAIVADPPAPIARMVASERDAQRARIVQCGDPFIAQ